MASNLRAMACCFFQETLTTLPRHVTQRLTATSCERASPPASGLNEEISKGPTGYNSDNLPAELTPAIPITFHLPFLALFISQSTAPPNIPVLWLLASFHTLPFKFPKSLMQVLISFPCRQRKKNNTLKKLCLLLLGLAVNNCPCREIHPKRQRHAANPCRPYSFTQTNLQTAKTRLPE